VANKIVLIGYMGVGKTYFGKELSKTLNFVFYDLDDLIEKKTKIKIVEIFKSKGEIFFRRLEREVLEELLNNNESFVLSTGGGTPCYYDNHKLLQKDNVISVYLKASINTIVQRLKDEKTSRPLIAQLSDEELAEFIGKHLFERSYYYNKSKYIVEVDDKTSSEVVQQIIDKSSI
jgi:shikimate kinase